MIIGTLLVSIKLMLRLWEPIPQLILYKHTVHA